MSRDDNSISAVATAGASGLGRTTAEALAAKGVRVAVFDLDEQKGEQLASRLGGPTNMPRSLFILPKTIISTASASGSTVRSGCRHGDAILRADTSFSNADH